MTLLEATSYVIAWAKDVQQLSGRPNKELSRALKRLEKRLDVLRLRQANAQRRRRQKAWKTFVSLLQTDPPICPYCKLDIAFGEFVKSASVNHRGWIEDCVCPACDIPIVLLWKDGDSMVYMVGRQCEGKNTLAERLRIHP